MYVLYFIFFPKTSSHCVTGQTKIFLAGEDMHYLLHMSDFSLGSILVAQSPGKH